MEIAGSVPEQARGYGYWAIQGWGTVRAESVSERATRAGSVRTDGRPNRSIIDLFIIGAICYRTCKLSCGISLAIMIKKNHYLKWT
jgi:hypothetical protein